MPRLFGPFSGLALLVVLYVISNLVISISIRAFSYTSIIFSISYIFRLISS
jgi:hypothetical protein